LMITVDNRPYHKRSGNGRSLIKWGYYGSLVADPYWLRLNTPPSGRDLEGATLARKSDSIFSISLS
jgi:hypothetical protein